MIDVVASDLSSLVHSDVKDYCLWTIVNQEFSTDCLDEFLFILGVLFGEAIYSKVDGCQSFHCWVISENTDIGSWS